MALFNRKKKNSVVLPEIEKYYEAERRERSGLAWILAAVSVAGVVLLLLGLFFGGKWAYHRVKSNKPVATITQKDSGNDTNKSNDKTDSNSGDKKTGSTNNSPAPSSNGNATPPAPSTSVPVTPAPSTSAPVPVVNNNKNLADTGPASVIPAFLTATALGTAYYRRKLKTRSTS